MTAAARSILIGLMFCLQPTGVRSETLETLANNCLAAVQAGDTSSFTAIAEAIKVRKDIFNTTALRMAEDCLSEGYGAPWEYYRPASAFMSTADVEDRLRAAEDAERLEAQLEADKLADAAQQKADREANAARIATMVYAACSTLLDRDEIAAMTTSVCVESFLANGLPTD